MTGKRRGLIDEYTTVWQTLEPTHQIGYCPSLVKLSNGRLLGTLLVYDDRREPDQAYIVEVHTSDDNGQNWVHRGSIPMVDAFPFAIGPKVYIIGGRDDLKIASSDDWGDTWSEAVPLDTGRLWYSFPGSAVRTHGRIYLVKECRTEPIQHGFPVWILAPMVLSASLSDDLTRPEAWTFSNTLSFGDILTRYGKPHLLGVPFYEPGRHGSGDVFRTMSPIGWGETNLIQITDPDHIWHDPEGRTFHMLLRCTTGRSNLAAMAKAVEQENGEIIVDLQNAPSGEPILYVPFPGGHLGFTIQHDPVSGLYWLISSQATDSMRRVDRLHPRHYGMPFNERGNLALYFSRNAMDWCFAGLLLAGSETERSCYHGSFDFDGDDLVVLMRTTDTNATNAHNSNLITFHRLRQFRDLIY